VSEAQTWWVTELYPTKDAENFGLVGDFEVMRIENVQALRDELDRLRRALEVAGDDICSEYRGPGPCHKKCLAVKAALTPAGQRWTREGNT